MEQSINYKLKIANDKSLSPTQNTLKPKVKKCNKCNKKRSTINEICFLCIKTITLSGNQVIDDFIKTTLSNCSGSNSNKVKFEFVPSNRF